MPRMVANALLLLAGAIWGMGFVAQSTAMADIGPAFFTGVRFLAAAAALLPFALWEARRTAADPAASLGTAVLVRFGLLGVALFAAVFTQQVGMLTTTVTNAGFLTGIYVVLVPVAALLILREPPHPVIWPAAALTLTGIFLLAGGHFGGLVTGDLWMFASAAIWSVHVLAIGRMARQRPRPFALAFSQFLACGLAGTGTAFLVETPALSMIAAAAPEILYAGIVSGGAAFTLQVIAQRHTPGPQAAIFLSSEALFAALFGAIFLGERIPAIGFLGCGLIFAAMLMVEIVPALGERRRTAAPHAS